ncbi:hypothetical protein ANO11243_082950 [Dothideomycetidae sp. 11243]|nr:hypothetical protein ANO11243_082950 [fungal sp. No.11243]
MAQIVPQRSPALHRQASSAPGYFEFNPSLESDTALIQTAMETSAHVHRLDAFHQRSFDLFDMPQDAHIYAARPLPPVPTLALKAPASYKSLRSLSVVETKRPSLGSQGRLLTTDCVQRQLPPLPLRAATTHRRGQSIESATSDKPSDTEMPVRRPRAMRSISFRNFLKGGTSAPMPSPAESIRTGSALSHHSDSTRSSRDSRHDSVVDDTSIPTTKTNSTVTGAPHANRRPSTLSLHTLRARKVSQESVPALPVRPSSARKSSHSLGSGRRWNLFGAGVNMALEDGENTPPVPITPPGTGIATGELSCQRCYYYSMRNCNGWVMGGTHGDACENCTVSFLHA